MKEASGVQTKSKMNERTQTYKNVAFIRRKIDAMQNCKLEQI